ncbi:MAG: alpha/beta fold hydrolase [Planctomycetota bacterium]
MLLLTCCIYGQSNAQEQQPANVILLFIDDLGYADTGPFGAKDIPTPNIDRLAKEGVMLTQTYVTNPPCCPSRCSLIMGMYGQKFGKYGMSRGLPIPKDKPTLAEFMRDNGYVTGQIGKWDIGNKAQGPSSRGFMEVAELPPTVEGEKLHYLVKDKDGKQAWLTDLDGDRLVEFVERNKDKPFFMYWSPKAVHSPHGNVPEALASRTTAPNKRRELGGGIVSVDDQVGKMLACLDRHGLRENTLIIFSSDNGPNLGEGGSAAPYRGGKASGTQQIGWTLSPTVMSWPGVIPEGERFDGLSCTLDFYATLAAAAGVDAPKHLDGVDLIPYLRGEKEGSPHEFLYWLNNQPDDAPNRHLVAVRWKQWRLYRQREKDSWQLFDISKDPGEYKNVAKQFPEVVEHMAANHAEWKKSHVPPPKIEKVDAKGMPPKGHGWVLSNGRVDGQQLKREKEESLDYLIALPKAYEKEGDAVPLILFLHGAGERGEDLEKLKKHGPPKMIQKGHDFGAIVVSPQCPTESWWTKQVDHLAALLDKIELEYNVDEKRIYVTGLSMGGMGAFALCAHQPDRFAAAVPICGRGSEKMADKLTKIPMWVFHGEKDKIVPAEGSKMMVRLMNAKDGENAKLTLYPTVGHKSWDKAYADEGMWKWLFEQRRGATNK